MPVTVAMRNIEMIASKRMKQENNLLDRKKKKT